MTMCYWWNKNLSTGNIDIQILTKHDKKQIGNILSMHWKIFFCYLNIQAGIH